jgi:hypothetical protein
MSHTLVLPNSGAVVPTTGAPDYGGGATDFALVCLALGAIDGARGNFQKLTAAGAIALQAGTVFLKAGSAAAMTLATPVSGSPGSGGNDGMRLSIVAGDAFAYTVTLTANKVDGADDTLTWAAAVGNNIELVAAGGIWYIVGTPRGVTLTEV